MCSRLHTCYKLPCIGPQSWPWIPTPCCCSWCYWCTICKMAGQYQNNRGRMSGLLKIRVQCLFSFIFLCLKLTAILNQGFFTQKDYKMFPPTVDWDNINWSTRRPQMDFPVQVCYIIISSMLICSAWLLDNLSSLTFDQAVCYLYTWRCGCY